MKVPPVRFLLSAAASQQFPPSALPDIAVAGRSNVGKSSLINCLFNQKRLAKISSTPGKTRLINFFEVKDSFLLADLPGYGYAKRSKSERAEWKKLVESYLSRRRSLRAMLVLMDSRRGPQDEEYMLFDALAQLDVEPIGVFTKVDKFSKSQRTVLLDKLKKSLKGECPKVLGFSSKTGFGKEELWRLLMAYASSSPS